MEVSERTAIAPYDPSLGGGTGLVWLVDNAPEPWATAIAVKNDTERAQAQSTSEMPLSTERQDA